MSSAINPVETSEVGVSIHRWCRRLHYEQHSAGSTIVRDDLEGELHHVVSPPPAGSDEQCVRKRNCELLL